MYGLRHKIKAGALQFSILISVVIAVTISAFILLTHIHLKFSKQIAFSGKTIALSKNGISYARMYDTTYDDSLSLSFETIGLEESVIIKKSHWGIFDKVISKGTVKSFTNERVAILGGSMDSLSRLALYLENTNTPLVVAGKTQIIGNVVLPSQGVKAGNIVGNYYQGKQLIYGNIRKTATTKPTLDQQKLIYLENLLFNKAFLPQEDILNFDAQAFSHTFKERPKWIYSSEIIELNTQSIANNVIIKSDSLIRVSAFAKAENVILVSPHIIIESNAKISLQAFASKSISIGEDTELLYPSAMVLMEQQTAIENEGIVMNEGSLIQGSVIHLSPDKENVRTPKISIAQGATVMGEVYSDEWLELFGTVKGTVYASELASRVRGSVYKNHLFNAVIDATQLPEKYSGIITSQSNKSVVQWVF